MNRLAKLAAWSAVVVLMLMAAFEVWIHRPLETPQPPPMMTAYVAVQPPVPPPPPPDPGQAPDLERRVFLDVNAATPAQVFNDLARTIGCTVRLDERLQRPVTLRVSNVTAGTALSAVCESIGCRWQIAAATLRVDATEPPPPIPQGELLQQKLREVLPAMNLKGVALGDALEAIHRETGIQISIENVDPRTPVTVDVSGEQPLMAAMKIMRAAGWTFVGGGVSVSGDDQLRIRIRPGTRLK
jgi:hypothetical protein